MTYKIEPLTQAHAEDIANDWKYPDEYAFYDMTADPEDYEELISPTLRGENYFQITLGERLIGFCCVFQEQGTIEFGLGMHPNLVGKGKGLAFSQEIIRFIEKNYHYNKLQLAVATFNERAIKVYRKLGFIEVKIYQQPTNGTTYEFLLMEKVNSSQYRT